MSPRIAAPYSADEKRNWLISIGLELSLPVMSIDRVGIGTDLHRLEAGRTMILGHVAIPCDVGPLGHSDGDVVLHAIIDAIAGAAGLPDIGEMFPDTDPAYKGADSGVLLSEAVRLARRAGYEVVNIDVTIHAERPKLKAYKQSIKAEVAGLLGISAETVNIKAKTNEGMDAIGRGEAIAATAVAGLSKKKE